MEKVCNRCGIEQNVKFFYDKGKATVCSTCVKNANKLRRELMDVDEKFLERERIRSRSRYRIYGHKPKDSNRQYKLQNTKRLMGIETKPGYDIHHWNYNLPLEGFVITRRLHKYFHTNTTFNAMTGTYRTLKGVELDTMEKNHQFLLDLNVKFKCSCLISYVTVSSKKLQPEQ